MIDLTKITTPFALLDDETRSALYKSGGPYECYDASGRWVECRFVEVLANTVCRAMPKRREYWIAGATAFTSFDKAKHFNDDMGYAIPPVHVREVLSDE